IFPLELFGVELRPRRDHTAADVHADRIRDDTAPRRDDAADRHAVSEMKVGHQSNAVAHDRMVREVARLLEDAVGLVDLIRPYINGTLLRIDDLHDSSSFLARFFQM